MKKLENKVVNSKKIVGTEVAEKINSHVLQVVSLQEKNLVAKVHPSLLFTCDRFDLMAKYIYAKYRQTGIDSDWGLRLYSEHIRIFNNYEEGDGTGKSGKEAFIDTFNKLLDSIKDDNFDENISIIPVGKGNLLIDGAHRTTACLLYNREVVGVFFDSIPTIENVPLIYNYLYFRQKGLANKWSDAMALEYCKLKNNTYVVVVFPSAVGKEQQVKQILQNYGSIVYEKAVYLVNEGPINLIKQIHSKESWLGNWSNNFSGARFKASRCFKRKSPTRVFVFESESLQRVTEAKDKIWKLFGIENHFIHSTDTHEETLHLAQLLLNDNSLQFLNFANQKNHKKFFQLLKQYKTFLEKQNADKECFCLSGSSVLAVYGLREVMNLNFIHYGTENINLDEPEISSHNQEMCFYTKTKDEIIYNPENHFYYDGLKFASLDIIKAMKEKRKEAKDIKDIKLIKGFLQNSKHKKIWLYLYFLFSRWGISFLGKKAFNKVKKIVAIE